ncbi:MAG: hypothetical protein KQH53_12040 [Desulfarculaceae bacterium]|nr:hypothetical protein [Desulfarculaceae bacterium]
MKAIELKSGLIISAPVTSLRQFVNEWYEMYDGINVEDDNNLTVPDIALSIMLNSRISGITGGNIYYKKASIDKYLAMIPNDVDLFSLSPTETIPGEDGIRDLVGCMCKISRVALSVTTKVIHKKRPLLIPIFDSFVEEQYCKRIKGSTRMPWGDYCVNMMRLVIEDMQNNKNQLQELVEIMKEDGTPMSACRILNALTWKKVRKQKDLLAAQKNGKT